MKQTIIALLAIVLLAACQQNAEQAKTATDVITTETDEVPSYEHLYISEGAGDTLIQNYHKYLRESLGIDSNELLTQDLSFMIDAQKLRNYLDAHHDIKMLDIYLARTTPDATGSMTLVYVGAKDSIVAQEDGETDTFYVEQVHYRSSDRGHEHPQVMDHAFPCPTCEARIRVFGRSHTTGDE